MVSLNELHKQNFEEIKVIVYQDNARTQVALKTLKFFVTPYKKNTGLWLGNIFASLPGIASSNSKIRDLFRDLFQECNR